MYTGSSVVVLISALILVSIVWSSLIGPKTLPCLLIILWRLFLISADRCWSLICMLFTWADSFSSSGIFIPGLIIRSLFFLSMMASICLRVSSPIMPSKVFRPGRTRNSIVVLFPTLSKNLPLIFLSIWISPPADWILKGLWAGRALMANADFIKFLLAPVSMRNFRVWPSLVTYFMYGMLERLLS